MRKTFLDEFEEIVLLSVAVLDDEAYAVSVRLEIERHTGRSVEFNTVHTTLQRLDLINIPGLPVRMTCCISSSYAFGMNKATKSIMKQLTASTGS